jgi:hypothetical protein
MAKKIRFLVARVILIGLGFSLPGPPDYQVRDVGSGSSGQGSGGVGGCGSIALIAVVLVLIFLALAYCQNAR